MKRILSLDGGGVRGALTTCFLVELERRTGKLCREYFDLVAGTSTGALIATAIAAGIPATTILEIYQQDCPKLFHLSTVESWAERILKGYAYHPEAVKQILVNRLGASASWKLNDSPVRLLLTAKGMNGHPWYFVRDNPKNAGTTGGLSLLDCAIASGAAPTYFAPWYVSPVSILVGWCFDGGTGITGNPVHQAVVEAFRYDDFDPADTRVISLGTGFVPDLQTNPPAGLLDTLTWTIDTLLDAPIDEQSNLVNLYYAGILQRYNWQLPAAVDMADAGAIPGLVELGQKVVPAMDWDAILKD